jgi:uncharacterized protein YuzE
MDPRVVYDREGRALTILLEGGEIVGTVAVDDDHLVDVDADGKALSIEILTPETPMIEAIAERFGIASERVPAIIEAVEGALATAPETRTAAAPFEVHGRIDKVVVAGGGVALSKGVSRGEGLQREIDLVP